MFSMIVFNFETRIWIREEEFCRKRLSNGDLSSASLSGFSVDTQLPEPEPDRLGEEHRGYTLGTGCTSMEQEHRGKTT